MSLFGKPKPKPARRSAGKRCQDCGGSGQKTYLVRTPKRPRKCRRCRGEWKGLVLT